MPEASTDPFGIGTSGFLPYGALNTLYDYYTYGPNTALNLLDLQTKANMQANLANQGMAWNLAQAAGSGNLMDNFAKQLYLGGLGPQPGMTSALQGLPSPFIGQQNMGQGFNQMLGQLPSWMQGQGNAFGTPPSPGGVPSPAPNFDVNGNGVVDAIDAQAAIRGGNQALGQQILNQVAGLAPSGNMSGFNPVPRPIQGQSGYPNLNPSGNLGGFQPPRMNTLGQPGGPYGTPASTIGIQPQTPNVTNLPFFKQFQTGNVGPAWNANMARPTNPALGINEGVKLPWEVANTFQRSNPMYKNQMLQTWQALGIPQDFAQNWMNAATPGYRGFQPKGLAF